MLLSPGMKRSFLKSMVRKVIEIYGTENRQRVWRNTTGKLLERSFAASDKGVVAFDWVTRNSPVCFEWVETVVVMAHGMGLNVVSLPHGDSPHANHLIRRGEWKLQPDSMYSAGCLFDKVVVPNELCAVRFRPFMHEKSIAVLGSPRFCTEWLDKLVKLQPPSPLVRSPSRLKLVIFLRKSDFTTFWEEVGEVVQMIAAFPSVEIIIKPHTRGGWRQPLTRNAAILRLPNVSIVADDIHSAQLMNWADVVMDLATSVVFEAVTAGKPVLAADYLHAGRSVVAEYMPETELRCRDDVYKRIDELITTGCGSFYDERHRQRFLKEIIHGGGDEDVLLRYVALLEASCQPHEVRQ